MIKNNVDILLISEAKIDSSFPTAQFHIDGFTIYRRDRNENGGGLLLYMRWCSVNSIENRSQFRSTLCWVKYKENKSLLCSPYNPNKKNLINKH